MAKAVSPFDIRSSLTFEQCSMYNIKMKVNGDGHGRYKEKLVSAAISLLEEGIRGRGRLHYACHRPTRRVRGLAKANYHFGSKESAQPLAAGKRLA